MTRFAIPAVTALATWDAWHWYFARVRNTPEEAAALIMTIALVGALGVLRRQPERHASMAAQWHVAAALALYAASFTLLPPIMRAAIAVGAVLYSMHTALFRHRPAAAFWGLVALSMPVLPSLQYVAGYPMRVVSAALTSGLLQGQGLAVSRQGTMLAWQGQMVEFDAPCSGVNMLWAAMMLAMMGCVLLRLGLIHTVLVSAAAIAATLFANVLRGASLFYMETNLVAGLPKWWHDAIGLAAFIMVAATTLGILGRHLPNVAVK